MSLYQQGLNCATLITIFNHLAIAQCVPKEKQWYRIEPSHSSKPIQVPMQDVDREGAIIVQHREDDELYNQLFRFEKQEDGSYVISNRASDMVLDGDSGEDEATENNRCRPDESIDYLIQIQGTGIAEHVLEVSPDRVEDTFARLHLWERREGFSNQIFRFERADGGSYSIRSIESGMSLTENTTYPAPSARKLFTTIYALSFEYIEWILYSAAKVVQTSNESGRAFKWILEAAGNHCIVRNQLTRLVLSAEKESIEDGTKIMQYNFQKRNTQRWKFVPQKRAWRFNVAVFFIVIGSLLLVGSVLAMIVRRRRSEEFI